MDIILSIQIEKKDQFPKLNYGKIIKNQASFSK